MDRKARNGAVTAVMFLGLSGAAFAGRVESSLDAVEPGSARAIDASNRTHGGSCEHRAGAAADAAPDAPTDSRLAEYLELHGRAVDGSIRSTMMPWSALQHIAN
jgi:hypothetical protein